MLVNGVWQGKFHPLQAKDEEGGFVRQPSQFRNRLATDGPFPVAAGRYHLYVSMVCPWAGRTLAARALLGLEDVITVSRVEPQLSDQGWRFGDGIHADPFSDARYLHELYTRADPNYTGRATVPVLWDKITGTIVNNESADILRILNDDLRPLATREADLFPAELEAEIDRLGQRWYERFNNGVYRAGFATTQRAYERAFGEVFESLDEIEAQLDGRTWLLGDRITALDIRIFVTLVRFDAAYHGLFKCNLRRIRDYPRTHAFMRRMLALPGMAETVDLAAIKQGYYSILALNPSGIVPLGPEDPFAP